MNEDVLPPVPSLALMDSVPLPDTVGGVPLLQVAPAGTMCPSGMEGIPLPFRLGTDAVVSLLLFFGVFLGIYVFYAGRKYLSQQLRGFSSFRVRDGSFDAPATASGRVRFSILLQVSLLLGIGAFVHFHGVCFPPLPGSVLHPALFLGILACLAYVLVKCVLFLFLGWLFFDRSRTALWIDSYLAVVYGASVLLYPVLLLSVYAGCPADVLAASFVTVTIMAKICVFYNCIKFFSIKFCGLFYLIVYFCALEIMPCLTMYKGLSMLSNLLLK